MKKAKRILMYGYFGAGNMGDEAILEVQSKILKQLAPDIEISIFTRNIERAKELNLIPYKFDNIFEIFEAIESCDLIISGGGELFQDITGTSTPLYYGLMMFLGKIAKKPVFAFGQGFGSITTKEGISYTKQLLQYCTIATFRDEESLKAFKEFAPNVPVYYTADPAFAYEQGNPEKGKELLNKMGVKNNKKIIYFSIREFKGIDYTTIAEGINKWYDLQEDKNIQFIIIPYQYCFDENISKNISNLIKFEHYITGELKVSEFMDLLAVDNCELIISTRLHGIILGSIANRCCVAISYLSKVQRICDILNAPYIKLEEITPESICNLLNNTWLNRKEICEKEYNIALKEKEKVYETAKMALDLLKD